MAVGDDKTLRICEAESGKLLQAMQGDSKECRGLVWTLKGKYLVSSGRDKMVRVWDPDKGELLHTLPSDPGPHMARSPDGSAVALGGDMGIRFVNPATGKITKTIASDSIWTLAWSRDGKTLVGSSPNDNLIFYDVESGQKKHVIPGPGGTGVYGVAWSPSGDRFISLAWEAAIWRTDTGKRLLTFPWNGGYKQTVAWSPDEKRLAVGSLSLTSL